VDGRLLRLIAEVLKYSEGSGTFFEQSIHLILLGGRDAAPMPSAKVVAPQMTEVTLNMMPRGEDEI
jgi:hypothetical protein